MASSTTPHTAARPSPPTSLTAEIGIVAAVTLVAAVALAGATTALRSHQRAETAGVAPMGVYSRFRSKEGLRTALATRAFARLHAALTSGASGEPAEQIRVMCREYRRFALAHPEQYRLIFTGAGPVLDPTSASAARGRDAFGVLIEVIRSAGTRPPPSGRGRRLSWSGAPSTGRSPWNSRVWGRRRTREPRTSTCSTW